VVGSFLKVSRNVRGNKSRPIDAKGAWFTGRTEHVQFLVCERAISKAFQKESKPAAYSICFQRISYSLEKLPFLLNISATRDNLTDSSSRQLETI
jgi:hypothetical protein